MSGSNKNANKADNNNYNGKSIKRYSSKMKKEIVLRVFRGESIDSLSRELGIESYIISQWQEQAIAGIEASLKKRNTDPLQLQLDKAKKHIGELIMDNELLKERAQRQESLFQSRRRK